MAETIDKPLSRDEAIRRLKALEPQIRALGLVSLFLFGSTARDEAGEDSDLDLYGDLVPNSRRGFDYFSLSGEIGDLMGGRRVDFIERVCLHPMLEKQILASGVRVF